MSGERSRWPELCPDDQRVLDALVDSGLDPTALETTADADRARQLMRTLGLLDDYPVEEADPALLDATMVRIDRVESERAARMRVEPTERGARGRLRLPDFITVAAVILIGLSISIPLLHSVRQRSIDTQCANNMRLIGYGLENYAADYQGEPPARAGLGEGLISLSSLLQTGYCDHGHLNCPGHHGDDDGFSTASRDLYLVGHSRGPMVVVGDRNPVLDAERDGRRIPPRSISINHGGRGQNVLATDGAVMWLHEPVVGRDNIWIRDRFHGRENDQPAEPDIFLRH